MKGSLKEEFGARFRAARDARKLSRAALGVRLGVSPKTIQSWEMGRTFIEDLSLVPAIEAELGITFAGLLGQVPAADSERRPTPAAPRSLRHAVAGPLQPQVLVEDHGTVDGGGVKEGYVAAPVVRPGSAYKEVADLVGKDILRYGLFPNEWCPRGRVVVAFRMGDSALAPAIPQGSTVLVDRRLSDPERLHDRYVALWLADRGLRIRRLVVREAGEVLEGVPALPNARGRVRVVPADGDGILGPVLGVCAALG